jgi:hypothetical protein
VDLPTLDRNIARTRRVIIPESRVGRRPHTEGIEIPALAHRLPGALTNTAEAVARPGCPSTS